MLSTIHPMKTQLKTLPALSILLGASSIANAQFVVPVAADDFDGYVDPTFVVASDGTNALVDDGSGGNALTYTTTTPAGGGFFASGFDWVPIVQPGPDGDNTSTDRAAYQVSFDITVTSSYVPANGIEIWLKDQVGQGDPEMDPSATLYSVGGFSTGVPRTVTFVLDTPTTDAPFGYTAGSGFNPTVDAIQVRINGLDFGSPPASGFSFTIDNFALKTVLEGDSDLDGLPDSWEVEFFGDIDLYDGDDNPDGDAFTNSGEYAAGAGLNGGSDPTNMASVPGDYDGDGFDDSYEDEFFGNNSGTVELTDLGETPASDFDGDLVSNIDEQTAGTVPDDVTDWPDIDSDDMNDAWEVLVGLDPGVDDSGDDEDSDGADNLSEHDAGSDPFDGSWTPTHALLKHRWSFNGDLNDSVGGSNAQIADPDANAGTGGDATLGATSVKIDGGARASSKYVSLGANLLTSLQSPVPAPVTIELWASQDAVVNWSRIFAFGSDNGAPGVNQALSMSWSRGMDQNSDRVLWNGQAIVDDSNAPYQVGIPHHIVMTIVPAYYSDVPSSRGVVVTWWTAPEATSQPAGHPLLVFQGEMYVTNADLSDLADAVGYLGRSMFPGDSTASATYDEVRIWAGALTETERELFQLLGPDNIDRTDSEPDGFPDQWEMAYFGDLNTATAGSDFDSDFDDDDIELEEESDPNNPNSNMFDRDADGLDDEFFELPFFGNLLRDGAGDFDNDGVSDADEEDYFTNPADPNSSPDLDNDDLPDGWEFLNFGDFDETGATNPDGDLDTNLIEFNNLTDPNDPFSGSDSEPDGLPDFWEITFFGDSALWGAEDDPDSDSFSNLEEFEAGSNPSVTASIPGDINGNGIPDSLEVFPVVFVADGFENYLDASFVAASDGANQLVDDGHGGNALEYTVTTPDGGGFFASGFDWVPEIQPGPAGGNTSPNLTDYVMVFDLTVTSSYVPAGGIEVWVKNQAEDPLPFAERSANLYVVTPSASGETVTVTVPLENPGTTAPYGYEAAIFSPTIDEWRIRINGLDFASPSLTEFTFVVDNFSIRTIEIDGEYNNWKEDNGLTAGVNDGVPQNPDLDDYPNVLEYQLGGDPLAFENDLYTFDQDSESSNLVVTFERYDPSEEDSTLSFAWSTDLRNWNGVPIGTDSSEPDADGVTVTVTEDGGSTTDYDLIIVELPISNAEDGRLFVQLRGTRP